MACPVRYRWPCQEAASHPWYPSSGTRQRELRVRDQSRQRALARELAGPAGGSLVITSGLPHCPGTPLGLTWVTWCSGAGCLRIASALPSASRADFSTHTHMHARAHDWSFPYSRLWKRDQARGPETLQPTWLRLGTGAGILGEGASACCVLDTWEPGDITMP